MTLPTSAAGPSGWSTEPITGSNRGDAIALALPLGVLLLLTPVALTYYPAEFPSYVVQFLAIVVFYAYLRATRVWETYADWPRRTLLLLTIIVPLEQMFLPHGLAKLLWYLEPYLLPQLVRVSNVLLAAVVVLALRSGRAGPALRNLPGLVKASFACAVAGLIVATLASGYPLTSLVTGLLEVAPVYVVLFALLTLGGEPAFLRHACTLFVLSALLVAASQVLAMGRYLCCDYPLYLPVIVPDFVMLKGRPGWQAAVGLNGYGNPGHYGALAVLLVPSLAAWAYTRAGGRAALVACALLTYVFFLLYSRSGAVILFSALVMIFGVLLWQRRTIGVAILALLAFFTVAHASTRAVSYHVGGLAQFASHMRSAALSEGFVLPGGRGIRFEDLPDDVRRRLVEQSAFDRAQAWRLGIEIASRHWLAGVGFGVYRITDPVYTSPHSLVLQRWAEGGIASALAIVLLAAYAPLRSWRLLREGRAGTMEFAPLLGVGSFFLQAFVFGGNLSMMGLIVWGYGIGLLMAASFVEGPAASSVEGPVASSVEGPAGVVEPAARRRDDYFVASTSR